MSRHQLGVVPILSAKILNWLSVLAWIDYFNTNIRARNNEYSVNVLTEFSCQVLGVKPEILLILILSIDPLGWKGYR